MGRELAYGMDYLFISKEPNDRDIAPLATHSCFEGEGGGEYSWTGFPIRLGMTKGFGFLNSAGEVPFFKLGVVEAGAAVVVDFIDIAIDGFNAIVVAVVPLPPAFATGGAPAETVVGPGLQNFRNNILAVVQAERHGGLDVAAGSYLYLTTEKAFGHGS